jgi:hypothetical protein
VFIKKGNDGYSQLAINLSDIKPVIYSYCKHSFFTSLIPF